ncbi:MAG: hypothetical protein AAF488_17780 [Planctomycetota bacterium]
MISTSEVSVSLTTDTNPIEQPELLSELREFAVVEVDSDRGMISLVGAKIGREGTVLGDVFRTVSESGAEVEMVSYGATRINLSFLVPQADVPRVVVALHQRYFE